MLVKTLFSIKDLENLSGVKAHTIRIWEKRYNLLKPQRTDTNIRQYNIQNLKKLLNVAFLYHAGYKISKIANFNDREIIETIHALSNKNAEDYAIQSIKSAMFEFDPYLFDSTYQELLQTKSFREIFYDVFIPLLNDIGTLWQTGTIDPAHEHFISEIIKQKIVVNLHEIQKKNRQKSTPTFVLFLPYEEIHEIGLLFAHYEILLAGFSTIYLGSNVPLKSLKYLLKQYQSIIFLTYCTVKPDGEITKFIADFNQQMGKESHALWLMGFKAQQARPTEIPKNIKLLSQFEALNEALSSVTQ